MCTGNSSRSYFGLCCLCRGGKCVLEIVHYITVQCFCICCIILLGTVCTEDTAGDSYPMFLFMLSLVVFDEVCTGDTSRSYCPVFLFMLSLVVCDEVGTGDTAGDYCPMFLLLLCVIVLGEMCTEDPFRNDCSISVHAVWVCTGDSAED